ncbi:response regulator [Pseudoalteromonas gelatinilytica]
MKKVLIVEDDKYFSSDLAELLDFEDITSVVKNSADEFWPELDNLDEYDAILLDIMMRKGTQLSNAGPGETGELLFNEIRRRSNIKVIVLSAKNKNEINIKFNKKNVKYLAKPLSGNLQELLELL